MPSVPCGLQAVPLQGNAMKEIHAILTETLACFVSGMAKDLSAPGNCKLRKNPVLGTLETLAWWSE